MKPIVRIPRMTVSTRNTRPIAIDIRTASTSLVAWAMRSPTFVREK